MRMEKMKRPSQIVRMAVAVIMLFAMLGVPVYFSFAADSPEAVAVEMPGADSSANNVTFAFDRYAIVAPYAPSNEIGEDSQLIEYDNHFVYLIDTKKPGSQPFKADLRTADGKVCYYPSKTLFDPKSGNLFIRGTRFEEKDGEYEARSVIAYLRLNLNEDRKPIFDSSVVMIDIRGGETNFADDAFVDFALGRNGNFLVFTNGRTIYTYNLIEGYKYSVDIVPQNQYSDNYRIVYLGVDELTNTIMVCVNKQDESVAGAKGRTSEIYFHKLLDDGTVDLVKRLLPRQFEEGISLTPGSNVIVSSETQDAEFGLFVTSDGVLCQVDLARGTSSDGVIKPLSRFEDLAQESAGDAGPRIIKYDRSRRTVGVIKQGFAAQIVRPINGRRGRPGGIVRPINAHNLIEQPVLLLARVNKRYKVVSQAVFGSEFEEAGGITGLVAGHDSQWLVSTYTGQVFSVSISGDIDDARLTSVAEIGNRIGHLAYFSARETLVAISSFESDEQGRLTEPGSLIVARLDGPATQSVGASLAKVMFSPSSLIGPVVKSIRRPCN